QMIFDPGRTILADCKTDKGESTWAAELAGATLAIDRIYAAKALARRGGAKALADLRTAMTGDAFWAVRGAAAVGLGALRTDDARARRGARRRRDPAAGRRHPLGPPVARPARRRRRARAAGPRPPRSGRARRPRADRGAARRSRLPGPGRRDRGGRRDRRSGV